jgi:hypothetical protein
MLPYFPGFLNILCSAYTYLYIQYAIHILYVCLDWAMYVQNINLTVNRARNPPRNPAPCINVGDFPRSNGKISFPSNAARIFSTSHVLFKIFQSNITR